MSKRYKIVKFLREGKAGSIHEARDISLERNVVFRRLNAKPEHLADEESKEIFIELACKVGGILHPNIAAVYDAGVDDEGAYIIGQLIEGKVFLDYIKEYGTLSEFEAFELAKQVLDALLAAKFAGIAHGAIGLRSIMVSKKKSGHPQFTILDLGIHAIAPIIADADSTSKNLTHAYLKAPELFDNEEPTELSDLYALGHLLYISLSGGHPFAGKTNQEVESCHRQGSIKPLYRYADVNKRFENWIHLLIDPNIDKRPASLSEAAKYLEFIEVMPPETAALLKATAPVSVSQKPEAEKLKVEKQRKIPPATTTGLLRFTRK